MAGVIKTQADTVLGMVASWSGIPNTLITWVTPVLLLGLTILIMWQGYKVIRGAGGQDHLLDMFFNSIRVFLIFSVCLVGGAYASNVMVIAQELREGLTGLFSGTTANVYTQLDIILNQSADVYKEIIDYGLEHLDFGVTGSDTTGIVPLAGGTFMIGFMVLYIFVAAINMIVIDFALAIFFALGPLFIACLAFQGTAQFFNTWLSGVLKYIFTAVVISAIVGLGLGIMQGYMAALIAQSPESIDYTGQTLGAVLAVGILVYLTFKGAQIGADLAGGVALNIMSLAQAARWAINPAGAALSNTAKATHAASKIASAGTGYMAGRASQTGLGKAAGSSSAMKYAMAGINTMAQIGSGTRSALSHRSALSAARTGFQSGASVKRGTGMITK
ncbi:type IV secretion system protein [Nitrosomonas eutropha]|jgi:type IV secretion system protein VirB6|uniref:Type IV secretion system protein VirB6 n=2 Tax=Nitrosomonas eutropha TaxID=916 RepID=A0ABX5M8B2_9PROT|nr:type IV secretion system protein [Nitrosomonas eutropha]ABI60835.1 TrbL/VirB6 plasmid conjugal transfer protein [Nitrosomonas eutropha C91]PXV79093.1 type IV secretion system protein VirB6 [Nitrosomonas eutropha]